MGGNNRFQETRNVTTPNSNTNSINQKRNINMDSEQANNRNNNNTAKRKKNLKLFSRTFWFVFIGTSVIMSLVIILANLTGNKGIKYEIKYGCSEIKVKNRKLLNYAYEANKFLKEQLDKILAETAEETCPELGHLHKKYIKDFKQYAEKSLNSYFSYIENRNIHRFLDWLYSWGTDYKIAYHSAKKLLTNQDNYLQRKIETLLFNPYKFERYLNSDIGAYAQELHSQFFKEAKEKFKENFQRIVKKKLKEVCPLVSKSDLDKIAIQFYSDNQKLIEQKLMKELGIKSKLLQRVSDFL